MCSKIYTVSNASFRITCRGNYMQDTYVTIAINPDIIFPSVQIRQYLKALFYQMYVTYTPSFPLLPLLLLFFSSPRAVLNCL